MNRLKAVIKPLLSFLSFQVFELNWVNQSLKPVIMSTDARYTAHLDFQKDYAAICVEELENEGYTVSTTDPFKVVTQFYNFKKRLPTLQSRIILKASTFTCPTSVEDGLKEVERKILAGESLKPYLSTRITDLSYNDEMLNDWGIYHLHLGTVIDTRSFVNRTGPLLYLILIRHMPTSSV